VETLLLSSPVPATFYAAVEHFCGSENVRFRIAVIPIGCLSSDIAADPAVFNAAQIYGQAAAAGVAAVAPVFYSEIDNAGNVQPPFGQVNVEDFSAFGGICRSSSRRRRPAPGSPVVRLSQISLRPTEPTPPSSGSMTTSTPIPFRISSAAQPPPRMAAVAALIRQVNLDSRGPRSPVALRQRWTSRRPAETLFRETG
jgi:hypothetical protein